MMAVSRSRLAVGMVVTGVLALSVHAVMLDVLNVPYPGASIAAPFWQYVSRGFLHVLGLVCVNTLGDRWLRGRGFVARSAVVFLLAVTLTESLLRGPFMDGYCTHSDAFAFASAAPKWVAEFVVAMGVVAAGRWLTTATRRIVGAAVLGAVAAFALYPAGAQASAWVQASLASLSHAEWCELPYGWNVNLPAYLSFAEPVLAAFALVALVWDGLSRRPAWRVVQFALLVLVIRRQLLAAFIYAALSPLPAWTGLAAMGQFSLEALALGVLTALTWPWARAARLR